MIFRSDELQDCLSHCLLGLPSHGIAHGGIDIENYSVAVHDYEVGQVVEDRTNLRLARYELFLDLLELCYVNQRSNTVPGPRDDVDMDKAEMQLPFRIDQPAFIDVRGSASVATPGIMVFFHPFDIVPVDEYSPAHRVLLL